MSVRRVLMVNRYFYPYLGGVEFHILNLSLELQRLGVEIAVATPRRGEAGPDVSFRGLPVHRFRHVGELGSIVRLGWDVIHAHMPRNLVAAAALHHARRARVPYVLTPHAFYPSSSLGWRTAKRLADATLTRWMLSQCAAAICLTPADRADAVARGLPVTRAHLVPNSVRISELVSVPVQPFAARLGLTRPFLLHVGRFDPVKNIDFLVSAHRRIEGLDLVLIGQPGAATSGVEALRREPALRERVHVVERASFADLCNAYRECAVTVLASSFEGLPTVLLEALLFGRPVVASAVGGVPFLVSDPALGATFPAGDTGAYLAAVGRVLAEDRPALRGVRTALVERGYSWEVNAAHVRAVYEAARSETAAASRTHGAA